MCRSNLALSLALAFAAVPLCFAQTTAAQPATPAASLSLAGDGKPP